MINLIRAFLDYLRASARRTKSFDLIGYLSWSTGVMFKLSISRCVKPKKLLLYVTPLKNHSSSYFHQDNKIFASGLFSFVMSCFLFLFFFFVLIVSFFFLRDCRPQLHLVYKQASKWELAIIQIVTSSLVNNL